MEYFSTIGFANPIVLSLDFDGITQTPHHSTIKWNRINGVKIHIFAYKTQPVSLETITALNN